MATIKAFSDLQQSKVLAGILPLESADMYYDDIIDSVTGELFIPADGSTINVGKGTGGSIAAWSLTTLLNVIPKHTDLCKSSSNENKDIIAYWCYNFPNNLTTECYDNPVDACYEMIIKLHELKML